MVVTFQPLMRKILVNNMRIPTGIRSVHQNYFSKFGKVNTRVYCATVWEQAFSAPQFRCRHFVAGRFLRQPLTKIFEIGSVLNSSKKLICFRFKTSNVVTLK